MCTILLALPILPVSFLPFLRDSVIAENLLTPTDDVFICEQFKYFY